MTLSWKKSAVPLCLVGVASLVSASKSFPPFTPTRVSFKSLLDLETDDALLTALKQVGLVSITDLASTDWNKQNMMTAMERCISNSNMGGEAVAAPFHAFEDGTRRRTLATRSLAGHAEPLFESEEERSSGCQALLEKESAQFRRVVQQVTNVLSSHLLKSFPETQDKVVLKDASGERSFDIQQVIQEGEHLEHFHCFFGRNKDDHREDTATTASATTIDWHTDQGLFLLFTPGQRQGKATDGFYIQLMNGTAVELHLDAGLDEFIIMLGDGVLQYMNPRLPQEDSFRAVPHAFQMLGGDEDTPRVWYGRMVLPPPQAVHPLTSNITFSELRSSMIEKDPKALSMGCASSKQVARQLHEGEHEGEEGHDNDAVHCSNASSYYCWHGCLNFTDFDVSPETCEERELSLGCANEEGYLWIDEIHSASFGLRCVNLSTAEFALAPTEAPTAGAACDGVSYLSILAVAFLLALGLFDEALPLRCR